MRARASSLLSRRVAPDRESLLLVLTDAEGTIGLGEASPLPPFSREDAAACKRALAGVHERLGEADDRAPAAESISLLLQRIAGDLDAAPAARFALESALLDLLAKRRGLSVAELLGGPRPYREVAVNGLLVADPVDDLADRAVALAAAGLSALKIKLRARTDAGFARELAALREVRRRLPISFELRLDPNAAWPRDVARERLAALAPIAPRFVEQPVAPEHLLALGRCAVPWAADESLALPGLADALLDAPGCGALVLKPAILGGLLPARDLALRAAARGLGVVVTHLFDGPVAMAAACELALSLPRAPLACGLDPHDRLDAFPPIAIPQLARRGLLSAAPSSGLGIPPSIASSWTT